MSNLHNDTVVQYDLSVLQLPNSRIILKRIYNNIGIADQGMSFEKFINLLETESGVKIPELQ
jgi:hypothetical protein